VEVFCSDAELGYLRSRTRFVPGKEFRLDEAYRLAHLPLIAPDHPDVIPSRLGATYRMGRHERIFSLVLPIPPDELEKSAAHQALEGELMQSPFANKIAWDLLAKRRERLHVFATIPRLARRAKVVSIDLFIAFVSFNRRQCRCRRAAS